MTNDEIIKSVDTNQHRIIRNIMKIYNIDEITADFTYSCGNFYKESKVDDEIIHISEPKYKFDVYPQTEDTIKIEKLGRIPLDDGSCRCIMYDPPFVICPNTAPSVKNPKEGSNLIQKRFASFYPVAELLETYYFHMKEMYRMLENDGYAIVKCQNTVTGQRQLNSAEYLWFLGESIGFDMIDKFVLVANSRLIGKQKTQQHSRRFESYFLVFKKSQKLKSKYLTFDNKELMQEIVDGFFKNNFKESKTKYIAK